jgi:hypothetical protein
VSKAAKELKPLVSFVIVILQFFTLAELSKNQGIRVIRQRDSLQRLGTPLMGLLDKSEI